jgi:hypothetical protein
MTDADARALIAEAGRIAGEVHRRNASLKFGNPRYSCVVGSDELLALVTALPKALDEIDRLTAESELRGNTVADLAHELGTVKAVRDQLGDEVDAMRPVVEAADNITRVKREAEKVFNTGLSGMYAMTQSSPLAMGLAKATADAGKKLERAVDAWRARKAGA